MELLIEVVNIFNLRCRGETDGGHRWRELEYFGIPKQDAEDKRLFSSLRWIAKSAAG